jgi:hypothetical protein
VRKLLLGGALGALPVLNLVAWGYLYKVFIDGLNGLHPMALPGWGDWKRYFAAGCWLLLIVLGYVLITAIGLTAVLSLLGILPTSGDPDDQATFLMLVLAALAFVYSFLPIVFARFAEEQRLWTAFDPWALWADVRLLIRRDYIQGCFLFFGAFLAGNLVMSQIPYAGLPLFSFLLFYMLLAFAHVFGLWIGRVKDLDAKRGAEGSGGGGEGRP